MKNLLTSFIAVLISASAFSQVELGIRAGVNSSSLRGEAIESLSSAIELTDGIVKTSNRTGFFAGGFLMARLAERVGLETGFYYSQKGYNMKGAFNFLAENQLGVNASAELQSHYIEIPVFLNVEIADGLYVYGGPQLSYLAHNNLKVKLSALGFNLFKRDFDVTEAFNKTDWSVAGGIGYKLNNFIFNAGYEHGLSRLDENGNTNSYNRAFKIGIGMKL